MISFFLTLAATTLTPTPAIQPEPTVSNSTVQDIQKIREIVQQKVKDKLKEITAPATLKQGLLGKVVQVDDNNISIEYQNTTKTLSYTDELTIIDSKRNKTTLDNLKTGQDILALGIQDNQNNSFEVRRIVFTTMDEIQNNHLVVVGKIVDISRSSPVFSLIPVKNKNNQYQIKTDSKTEIVDTLDKIKKSTDLESGSKIVTVLVPDPKMTKTYYAKKIIITAVESPTPTPIPEQ